MATEPIQLNLAKYLSGQAKVFQQPKFLKAAAEIMTSSIIRSFQLGGRTSGEIAKPFDGGSVKWRPVNQGYAELKKKAGKSADNVLLYTGRLRNSVQWQLTPNGLELGSGVTYAAIHQFGGEVRVTPKSRAYFRYRAATAKTQSEVDFWIAMSRRRGDTIRMPARPFITVQKEDYEDIAEIAVKLLS